MKIKVIADIALINSAETKRIRNWDFFQFL